MITIRQWLQELELGQYADAFEANDIDLGLLPRLNDQVLKDVGVSSAGHRLRMLGAIEGIPTEKLTAAKAPAPEAHSQATASASQAQRRQLSVMFCDLAGSTALAEQLDPEELRDLMQAYQRACRGVVEKYDGHVAQYLGDGLMVYFGWPRAHEDDAVRAVRAGLEVTEAVSTLTASTPLRARVGIHTGLVVVGETGQGDASVPKAAVGETPNIAARLQALAEPGSVVVSERTKVLAEGLFDYADLGVQALKGVSEQMHLFRVAGARATDSRFDAAHGEVALTPLVGREEEVELLLRRWAQAKEGEGQVVLLGGEPGIGKSRVTQVLRSRIAAEPHIRVRFQCSPFHTHSALHPVIEQFERAADFAREDTPEQKLDKMEAVLGEAVVDVEAVAPLFAALLSLPVDRYAPLNLSPQKQKEKTLEALSAQIEALSTKRPVLMLLEDAHWVDPTTQEALDLTVSRLAQHRILVVVTYRPEYISPWVGQANVTILTLNRLNRRQGSELVTKVTAGKALPPEVLDQILAHTDGVPLFIEELTKSVLESRLLRDLGEHYVLDTPLPALAIPTTLRDSLLARLDRLAPIREIAQIGACIGREFSYELLAAVSPLKGVGLDEALEQLTKTGLVHRRGMPPDAIYMFKHALVQDTAYDSLLKSRRAQLHAQIAQVLEKDFFDQVESAPELLAHHYTQAGNLPAAIPSWQRAGELAVRRVALQEAVGHFQNGLALIDRLPPSRERDELELSIREPLTAAWIGLRSHAAPEVGMNAAAILQRAKSEAKPQSLLVGLWGMWVNIVSQGRIAESLGWAQRLLAEGDQAQDSDLQIWGHATVMNTHFVLGRLLEAREHGNRVLALYDPRRAERFMQLTGHDLKTVVGLFSPQWTWMLGYPDQAVQMTHEKDAHARRLGHAFNLCFALTRGGWAFDYRCEPERLLDRASEADRLAREQSIPFVYQRLVPTTEGLARLRSGHLSQSISLLRRSIESSNGLGAHIDVPHLKSALAEALALQGDLDAALDLIDECLEQIERPGWQERVHLAEVLRLKGWMLIRQGRAEEAEAQLRASIDWARKQQAKSWELRSSTTMAKLLAGRGQRAAARELLSPIYGWFTEGFDTKDLKDAKALLEELSAR